MSSARIDPPKRVLGLKEGLVTPPPLRFTDNGQKSHCVSIHGDHRNALF
ncbi:unnamed protein product [Brassica rapa subsp. narinosa]